MDLKKKINKIVPYVSDNCIKMLETYLEELWRWNQKINLVGVSSYERLVEELLLDSIMTLEFIPDTCTMLDIGSGAGFPAIPIKIIRPKMTIHLVESRSKKAVFLRHIIRRLKLKYAKVIQKRVEYAEKELFPFYDVITFRGLRLKQGLSFAHQFIKDGIIIAYHGESYKNALKEALSSIKALSLHIAKEYSCRGKKRYILIFKKN